MNSRGLQSLPPEILDKISQFIPASDMLPLSLVMKHFHELAAAAFAVGKALHLRQSKVWLVFTPPGDCSDADETMPIRAAHRQKVATLIKMLDKFGGEMMIVTTKEGLIEDFRLDKIIAKRIILEFLPLNTCLVRLKLITGGWNEEELADCLTDLRIQHLQIYEDLPVVLESLEKIEGLAVLTLSESAMDSLDQAFDWIFS
ncbi:hypothetical protein HK100_005978 [Physocladia obscura]|uniref:F-box domain-containing protein n=1 Tax=Physocladia obscura TaxID=109957 RepID=A0AAD5SSF3_9FUNG|nr:hypothetical protein HK100_005978 [Physocladia obscura]